MNDMNLIEAGGLQRHIQCLGHVPDFHRHAELPGNDVAREVVQDRAEIEPALRLPSNDASHRLPSNDASHRRILGRLRPADDLEIGEVRLPKLVGCRRLVLELVGGLHSM